MGTPDRNANGARRTFMGVGTDHVVGALVGGLLMASVLWIAADAPPRCHDTATILPAVPPLAVLSVPPLAASLKTPASPVLSKTSATVACPADTVLDVVQGPQPVVVCRCTAIGVESTP